jgi:hypothetical protein
MMSDPDLVVAVILVVAGLFERRRYAPAIETVRRNRLHDLNATLSQTVRRQI